MLNISNDWPDNFDFETNDVCQLVFRPFIEEELQKLKEYDGRRPDNITYIFHEHTRRAADNIRKTCLHMRLGKAVANNMYWAMLPHDIGKRKLPIELWDIAEKPDGYIKRQRRSHTNLGSEIVRQKLVDVEHPFKNLMLDVMLNHHEQMDGKGFHGLTGDQITLPVRLAAIIEAYDGWRIWRPHYGERDISIPGVLKRMRDDKGTKIFDMELFENFAEMKMLEYNGREKEVKWNHFQDLKP